MTGTSGQRDADRTEQARSGDANPTTAPRARDRLPHRPNLWSAVREKLNRGFERACRELHYGRAWGGNVVERFKLDGVFVRQVGRRIGQFRGDSALL